MNVVATPVLIYFLVVNTSLLVLMCLAGWEFVRQSRRSGYRASEQTAASQLGQGVSVVVPSHDEEVVIVASVKALLALRFGRHEVIVVDDASGDPEIERLAAVAGIRLVRQPENFGYLHTTNAAAKLATGEFLLLLNNDLEMPEPGWWRALLLHAIRPGLAGGYNPGAVGIVGARLLYRDGTLQHGGMVLGPDGRATHVLRGAPRDAWGYEGQLAVPHDVAAVTGACMAIPREVWNRVGGMNEDLPVAWNDVDLCQRVRAAGLRVIWTPDAVLTHLEGETRGQDADDPDRQARFLADAARYRAAWGAAADDDPFLNPNLSAVGGALVLAPPRRPRPWT